LVHGPGYGILGRSANYFFKDFARLWAFDGGIMAKITITAKQKDELVRQVVSGHLTVQQAVSRYGVPEAFIKKWANDAGGIAPTAPDNPGLETAEKLEKKATSLGAGFLQLIFGALLCLVPFVAMEISLEVGTTDHAKKVRKDAHEMWLREMEDQRRKAYQSGDPEKILEAEQNYADLRLLDGYTPPRTDSWTQAWGWSPTGQPSSRRIPKIGPTTILFVLILLSGAATNAREEKEDKKKRSVALADQDSDPGAIRDQGIGDLENKNRSRLTIAVWILVLVSVAVFFLTVIFNIQPPDTFSVWSVPYWAGLGLVGVCLCLIPSGALIGLTGAKHPVVVALLIMMSFVFLYQYFSEYSVYM